MCLESPFSTNHNLNIFRPGVLRQYYGSNCHYSRQYSNTTRRFSYGVGHGSAVNSVGSDENNLVTRELKGPLAVMANLIHELVFAKESNIKYLYKNRKHKNPIQKVSFNHCTVLLYYSIKGIKHESTLGAHCDCTYGKDGTFKHNANSQTEDTVTASFTIGDQRVVNFYIRKIIGSNGADSNGNWVLDENEFAKLTSSHGDIMILHPDDERPFFVKHGNETLTTQILHGN